jgi:hypothetical protein
MPALHYKEALAAWRHPCPANDNAPLTADSFATLRNAAPSSSASSVIPRRC